MVFFFCHFGKCFGSSGQFWSFQTSFLDHFWVPLLVSSVILGRFCDVRRGFESFFMGFSVKLTNISKNEQRKVHLYGLFWCSEAAAVIISLLILTSFIILTCCLVERLQASTLLLYTDADCLYSRLSVCLSVAAFFYTYKHVGGEIKHKNC